MPKTPPYLTGSAISSALSAASALASAAGAAAAASAADTLTDTAIVTPRIAQDDGHGGDQWVDGAAFSTPCQLSKASKPREVIQAGAVQILTVFEAQFAVGTALKAEDGVEINGQFFEVLDTDAGITGAALLTAWLVRRS